MAAKRKAPAKKPPSPPDTGHQRCIDAYHDAFLARVGQRPIVGGREANAVKRIRASFAATKKTDDDVIAWFRAFYSEDWRAETTSVLSLAADPTRYLTVQKRFSRPEIGRYLQRGDDNMPSRHYTDEDFK